MITAHFGITQAPFSSERPTLLPQQQQILDLLAIHAQQGGFSAIVGEPGVGKSVLREHIQTLGDDARYCVLSITRTLHSYLQITKQLGDAFELDTPTREIENALIQAAWSHSRENKTLYTLIDDAHLIPMPTLRKLRLLFERFPRRHNLVLFGQSELFYTLSLQAHADIHSRISDSQSLYPLNDEDLEAFIHRELDAVKLSRNPFDPAAIALIVRSVKGNLRLCRNLALGALAQCCQHGHRQVSLTHVNDTLIQPHWRSHQEIITQGVDSESND